MATHPAPIPTDQNKFSFAFKAISTTATTGSKAVTVSRRPSHLGLRRFIPANCRRPLIGCRLSVKHALPAMCRTDTKARDGPRMCFDQNERASFHCEAFLEQFL